MKLGLQLPNFARWFRGDAIFAVCEKAKELEFDALCFVDHIMITPRQYVGYGNGYMDVFSAMSYVAAVTKSQGWNPILTQGLVVVPYRPPVQQAKLTATVDSLTGGKLMFGVGSGYNENEFRSLGLDVTKRGDMTDEYLACMKELWTHPVASFHGKYVNFDEMTISVRPVGQPHPPILYGSHGPRPRRRIAERYQGSLSGPAAPGRATAEALRANESDMADLNRLWKENGRSGKPYLMAMSRQHLTTDPSQIGSEVVKGLNAEGPAVAPIGAAGTQTAGRMPEGAERAYISMYYQTLPTTMVEHFRRLESEGIDMTIVWVPSYRYGSLDNLGMQLQQMEIYAEHVLPKIKRDKKPIQMDFGGKPHTLFAAA